jgi:hypothetical protein
MKNTSISKMLYHGNKMTAQAFMYHVLLIALMSILSILYLFTYLILLLLLFLLVDLLP